MVFWMRVTSYPGVSLSTKNAVMPPRARSSGSVTPKTSPKSAMALPALQRLLLRVREGAGLLDLLAVRLLRRADLPFDEVADGASELEQLLGDVQQGHVDRPPVRRGFLLTYRPVG